MCTAQSCTLAGHVRGGPWAYSLLRQPKKKRKIWNPGAWCYKHEGHLNPGEAWGGGGEVWFCSFFVVLDQLAPGGQRNYSEKLSV